MSKFIVLLFHSIDDAERLSLKGLGNIRPDLFEKVLLSLKKEFDIVSLEEIVECISKKESSRERLLAITFDDGTESYKANAVPIMESLGIPSTCFLITGCVDDRTVYWRYLYNFCINIGKGSELADFIRSEYKISVLTEEIISFTRGNYDKEKNRRILENIFREIISENEYRDREGKLFLSLDDIKKLKNRLYVSFGIHTHTHLVMMKLKDNDIYDEISESLNFYKSRIQDSIPMFSIPFGRLYKDYDERTVVSAMNLSIDVILSAYGGYNKKNQPLYNICRLPVNEGVLKNGIESFVRSLHDVEVPPEYIEKEDYLNSVIRKKLSF
jgi:peptidoglycan/xylan/chitin deacetylase (PgdA/CDA1 family)